jgi:FkbM family methyltransferase
MFNYTIPETCTHVKLDIGLSYNAPQSQNWLTHDDNQLMVFGFEPNPESIHFITSGNNRKQHESHGDCLEDRFIKEGRFVIQKCALSNVSSPETMKFYISNNDCGTSSLFSNNETSLGKIKDIINVPVYSLKMFFDGFPWDRFDYIDYIKIDAQGSDLNILKGAEHYLQDRVVFVTAEGDGHHYIGSEECSNYNIIKYMESQNFIHINHHNTKDPTFINRKFQHLTSKIYISQS